LLIDLINGKASFGSAIAYIIASLLVIFVTLPFHEYAHAFAADKLGDRTARYQGRLTLNPLAHIDYLGALAIILFGFGWARPVPVNANNFEKPKRDMAITAAAGPVMNLALAFLGSFLHCFFAYIAIGKESIFCVYVALLFDAFCVINIGLAVFNLLPIPPLDGWKVLGAALPARIYWKVMSYERYISFAVILLICTGTLSVPLGIVRDFLYSIVTFIPRLIFRF
jgi:Zn-dependent protease